MLVLTEPWFSGGGPAGAVPARVAGRRERRPRGPGAARRRAGLHRPRDVPAGRQQEERTLLCPAHRVFQHAV